MEEINTMFRKNNYYRVFLLFGLMMSLMIVNNVSAASTLTLTSSGSQDINVGASAGSAISADSINVATNCRYGYNLTLSTSVNDNNLYLNGDSSNNTAGTYFEPTDGTSALNATTNKWGYYYNASTTPTSTSVFSPVPTLANPATVKTPLTTPASSDINDNFNIYYGVSSSPTMAKGTYKMIPDTNNSNNDGTLVYTATVADACSRYTVHFSPTSIFEGNTLSGTGTMNDQSIYEGVATQLTANSFTAPSGYYFNGWNTAQDGSGTSYSDGQSVTDLTTVGNTITLYAQWIDYCPGGNICYSSNVSDNLGVLGNMSVQSIDAEATSAMLYAPNYKRDNYGFVSWNTKSDGSGTNYGPNQTIEFTVGQYNSVGLALYANWLASSDNIQDWTGCSNMSVGDVTALRDTRDNNVYAVAKLADNKCWMIENLRLDNTSELTSTNTHNPTISYLSNPKDPTQESWCVNLSANCFNQSLLSTNNTSSFGENLSGDQAGNIYSYGNYYNWYSATAGNGTYNSNSSVTGDICPSGWRLPKGGKDNDFWNLSKRVVGAEPANTSSQTYPYYNGDPEGVTASNKLRLFPNNFIYSGEASGSIIDTRGGVGHYWSSTAHSDNYSYDLVFSNIRLWPSRNHFKYQGYSVRCVAGT